MSQDLGTEGNAEMEALRETKTNRYVYPFGKTRWIHAVPAYVFL